ncbi:hypothetical protein AWB71_04587 [Caballeronia peredens]|nr:hypothetical protein AWB71_04587 [Caballeronia peredens]
MQYFYLICVILGLVILAWFMGHKLPDEFQIISYLFFFACVATFIVIRAAIGLDAMGEDGSTHSVFGNFLMDKLFQEVFDFDSDIFVLLGFFCLVITPQLLTYLLCAFFGCASAPIWITNSLRFVLWSLAKTFSVAGGVLILFATYSYLRKWPPVEFWPEQVNVTFSELEWLIRSLTFGLSFLFTAYALIVDAWIFKSLRKLYRTSAEKNPRLSRVHEFVRSMHKKAKRNRTSDS